jgi:hypothetical protein
LPPRDKKEADVAYALRACTSFAKFYQLSGCLVLVLRPSELTDVAAHHDWLAELAKLAPAGVRAVLLDSVEEPVHAALDARDPARIVVQRALLDMPEALIEVSEAAGHLDTPGGQFRDLFVRMSGAIAKNDIAAALPLAAAAVAVAQANRLWYLAVPVHIAIATTLLGAKRGQEAIAQYVAAEVAAQRGVDDSESGSDGLCQRLLLEARISHGTALIVLEKFTDAASHFELTAQLAAAEKAWLVAFDARRLVSFCWERAGDETRAWQTGLVALRSARLIDPSERATSTLPHLGEALSRLAKSDRKPSAQAVARELAELLDGQHFMAADGGASTSAAHA